MFSGIRWDCNQEKPVTNHDNPIKEDFTMGCGNNFFGGNCTWILILILVLVCCCGNNNAALANNDCGCGCGC